MQKGLYCQKESWNIMIYPHDKERLKNEHPIIKIRDSIFFDDGWAVEDVPNILWVIESFMRTYDKDIQ